MALDISVNPTSISEPVGTDASIVCSVSGGNNIPLNGGWSEYFQGGGGLVSSSDSSVEVSTTVGVASGYSNNPRDYTNIRLNYDMLVTGDRGYFSLFDGTDYTMFLSIKRSANIVEFGWTSNGAIEEEIINFEPNTSVSITVKITTNFVTAEIRQFDIIKHSFKTPNTYNFTNNVFHTYTLGGTISISSYLSTFETFQQQRDLGSGYENFGDDTDTIQFSDGQTSDNGDYRFLVNGTYFSPVVPVQFGVTPPKTVNAYLTYNSREYAIGIPYPQKTVFSLAMNKLYDSENLIVWRDKTSQYDAVTSEVSINIDNYNTEYDSAESGDQIKLLQDILVGRIDVATAPTIRVNDGVYPFSPLYDLTTDSNISIMGSALDTKKSIKHTWDSYKLELAKADTYTENTTIECCSRGSVWQLNSIELPDVTFTPKIPLVFSDRLKWESVNSYKTPTIAKNDIVEVRVVVSDETARVLLKELTQTVRGTTFTITTPLPLYPFGRQYNNTSFSCILYDSTITCETTGVNTNVVTFTIQNRGGQ